MTDTNEEPKVRVCVTNTMHDFRSCAYRETHTVNCDGRQYAWSEARNREETTGRECKGCRPREARFGYLCLADHEKAQNALIDWAEFAPKIAEAGDRAVQRDNGGIAGQQVGYVPLPGTMLAVEEIRSYYRSYTGSLDTWVSTPAGAADAVRFARAVSSAIRTHAVEEKAHNLNRTRCAECRQLTLVWHPTLAIGGEVNVKCSNCGHSIDQSKFETLVMIEGGGKPKGLRATGGRDEFADPYDPTRPDHADLDPLTLLTTDQLRAMLPEETPKLRTMRRTDLINAIHEEAA